MTGPYTRLLAALLALTLRHWYGNNEVICFSCILHRTTHQSEVLPALAERVLYAEPPVHTLLGLNLPHPHRLARLLHPQPVQSRPARTLHHTRVTRVTRGYTGHVVSPDY